MNSVLYDAPGPRTRAKTVIASIVSVPVILLLAYLFIYKPLDDHGQFEGKLWAPMFDPSDPNFHLVWERWRDGWSRDAQGRRAVDHRLVRARDRCSAWSATS